jgi:hypothetical protein
LQSLFSYAPACLMQTWVDLRTVPALRGGIENAMCSPGRSACAQTRK